MIEPLQKLSRMLVAVGVASVFLPASSQAQLAPVYTVSTLAGNGTAGFTGDGSAAASAELSSPYAIALDGSGNIYVADSVNNRIRKISGGTISTVVGDGTAAFKGDGGAATSAELNAPTAVALDSAGNLYIADTGNNVVRKVTTSGTISTFAGSNSLGAGFTGDTGVATAAQLRGPSGLAVDSAGNVYIADTGNSVIRKVSTAGTITTFAGFETAVAGFQGDGGPATGAEFSSPLGICFDTPGNLYITDRDNNRIRKVALDGTISTIAGSFSLNTYSGDGGPATKAVLNNPASVTVDKAGNVFIADRLNSVIRLITPDGIIHTVAGIGSEGFSGDGGPATSAAFGFPTGVVVDASGNLYVVDNQNNRIRLLTAAPEAPSVSANGVVSASAYGAFPTVGQGDFIEIYGSNLGEVARGWASADFNGPNAPTNLSGTTVSIGGVPAFVSYVSAGQVNALVPSSVGTGSQQLTVTTPLGTSSTYTVNVAATQPGILAPPNFIVGAKQYAVAFFADLATYVAPTGAVAGVNSHPAHVGDTIILYGLGFGPVTPDTPAGTLASGSTKLTGSLVVNIGGVQATVSYAGLAPTFTGLYQLNVVVPNVPAGSLVPLTFSLNGTPGTQTLYVAVQ